jgi:hypothetical protein
MVAAHEQAAGRRQADPQPDLVAGDDRSDEIAPGTAGLRLRHGHGHRDGERTGVQMGGGVNVVELEAVAGGGADKDRLGARPLPRRNR